MDKKAEAAAESYGAMQKAADTVTLPDGRVGYVRRDWEALCEERRLDPAWPKDEHRVRAQMGRSGYNPGVEAYQWYPQRLV